jgi:hypothetical protein
VLARLEAPDAAFVAGVQGARASAAFGRARESTFGADAEANLRGWLTLMVEMPRKMDDVLAAITRQRDARTRAPSRFADSVSRWLMPAAAVAMMAMLMRQSADRFEMTAVALVIGVLIGLMADVATRS